MFGIGRLIRKIRRTITGQLEGDSGVNIGVGFILERLYEVLRDTLSDHIKENPRQAAHILGYMAQMATKNPSPQTRDLFQDALTLLQEEDPDLGTVMAYRIQNLIGPADPDSRRQNRAQNLFVVIATHFPDDPEDLAPNKRDYYVRNTARRLRMYAELEENTWKAWADGLNLNAPERETWYHHAMQLVQALSGFESADQLRLSSARAFEAADEFVNETWADNLETRLNWSRGLVRRFSGPVVRLLS